MSVNFTRLHQSPDRRSAVSAPRTDYSFGSSSGGSRIGRIEAASCLVSPGEDPPETALAQISRIASPPAEATASSFQRRTLAAQPDQVRIKPFT
ncbi:hypothetical protein ZHAS_00012142 [Anopheles sinensis]|uniref:Uncharacterized protein n=1 Tax=Anopheles sinensis TaxID=74873 RepID=A0A084W203_ANOSI|nr:hypothetical protein ZHAS_00012142 [Anopheles sinensis]